MGASGGRSRQLFVKPGDRFGRLTVVAEARTKPTPGKPKGVPGASCRCECGRTKVIAMSALFSGDTQSCGCMRGETLRRWMEDPDNRALITARNRTPEAREQARQRGRSPENVEHLRRIAQLPQTKKAWRRYRRSPAAKEAAQRGLASARERVQELAKSPEWAQRSFRSPEAMQKNAASQRLRLTTHGLARHPLYQTWKNMIRRCEDPASISYKNYGGRPNPVTVCPEWHDVRVFIDWIEANLGPRPAGMTLDRKDNNGNYEPGNVKWSTWSEQHANKREQAGALNELLDAHDTGMWCPTCGEQVGNERAFDRHYRQEHARSR